MGRLLNRIDSLGVGFSTVLGGTLVVAIALTALLAPVVAPYDPNRIHSDARALPPLSPGFLLGTDELGRDVLSRLIWGGRISLFVALVPTAVAFAIGAAIGMVAGYVGGFVDGLALRMMDVILAFPTVLLALGIAAALGPSMVSIIVAIAVARVPAYARLLRASVLSARNELYVESARAIGVPALQIMVVHILRNVIAPSGVYATIETGRNVTLAAGLSFLGLGVQPPTAEWGLMLSAGRPLMARASHVATMPGVAIVLLTLGLNLLGNGMRDLLDPRTRRLLR